MFICKIFYLYVSIMVYVFAAHVKSKVDLLFSAVSARFFSGENLCNSK